MHASTLTRVMLLATTALAIGGLQAEQVTVQTTECDGATGFSSFDERRIYRIQPGPCPNPATPDEPLQQILLHSGPGISRFDVLWVTAAEARAAMEQIQMNRIARQNRIRGNRVVIVNPLPAVPPKPRVIDVMPSAAATLNQGPPVSGLAPPVLEIIEPPVADSAEEFVTGTNEPERLIVGRVQTQAGLISVSINGRPLPVSARGIFKGTVSLRGERTPVEIVAVDGLGQRSARRLSLIVIGFEETATPAPGD